MEKTRANEKSSLQCEDAGRELLFLLPPCSETSAACVSAALPKCFQCLTDHRASTVMLHGCMCVCVCKGGVGTHSVCDAVTPPVFTPKAKPSQAFREDLRPCQLTYGRPVSDCSGRLSAPDKAVFVSPGGGEKEDLYLCK